jgi:phosphate uptake regulator
MFRSIVEFWKGRDFLEEVLSNFSAMLIDAEEIYRMVADALVAGGDAKSLGDRIYEIDRKINEREQLIRRRIVEHLSVQPHADLRISLVLMSVVKDAERLGDYVKNVFEVYELHRGPFAQSQLDDYFGSLPNDVGGLFKRTHQAFVKADEDVARSVIGARAGLQQKCNGIVERVAHDDKLSVNDAVCMAVFARFLKRITAHLGNIATSVVVPVDRLDFWDERQDRQGQDKR